MKLQRYLENRYQELAKAAAMDPEFSMLKDGESRALQWVLSAYRFVFAALLIPKVFMGFLLVLFRITKPPVPELDLLKAQHDQDDLARKNKMRRKVGIQPGIQIGGANGSH